MKQKHADYQVVSYPKIRRFMAAARRSVPHKSMMHGLIEVDVTRARAFLRDHKAKTREALSFTAFIIACVAKAVDENKAVRASRKGRKHLILFEDVDVYLPIEHDMAGQKQPIPSIIRAANRKTVREIHQEIRAAQVQGVTKDLMRFQSLPTLLFKPYLWIFTWRGRTHPQVRKKNVGTVGGIAEKPGVVNGAIAIRDYLSLTISFDHDIVDGAPAARFTERLKDLIESGYGLGDSTVESEQAGAKGAVL